MRDKKFSISVTVKDNNGFHVGFVMHVAFIPRGMAHEDAAGRCCLGDRQCLRVDEFEAFIAQLKPDVFYPLGVSDV